MVFDEKLKLTNETVDSVSDRMQAFLEELETEHRNALMLRLAAENILLDWQEFFGCDSVCHVKMGARLGMPYISFELAGERFNPLEGEDGQAALTGRLYENLGLLPAYSYDKGCNRVLFRLRRRQMGPVRKLVIALLVGLSLASGGMLLPEDLRALILSKVLDPICDAFMSMLGCVAGPTVFLSVCWGILGIGDAAVFEKIGKRLMSRSLALLYPATLLAVTAAAFIYSLDFSFSSGGVSAVDEILLMILDFLPPDIISPFQTGNTVQIIFLGFALGLALLYLGKQTEQLTHTVEQLNRVISFLVETVSRIIPVFICVMLMRLLWSGSIESMMGVWKPVLLLFVIILVSAAASLLYTAARTKTAPALLLKKILPATIVALSTASGAASFGAIFQSCDVSLGIDKKYSNFSIPLNYVLFPIGSALSICLTCTYITAVSGVSVSPDRLLILVFSGVTLAIACPPIPGGALAFYAMLFTQLGLPESSLAIALTLDLFCDFLATGFNIFTLQVKVINQAADLEKIDFEVLHRPG